MMTLKQKNAYYVKRLTLKAVVLMCHLINLVDMVETKGTQLKDYRNEPIGEQVMHKEDLHRLNEKLDKDPKMKAIVEKC